MIRVRENINLTQLTKYGFKRNKYPSERPHHYSMIINEYENDGYMEITVGDGEVKNLITISTEKTNDHSVNYLCFDDLDILYNLISDGLVEKV
jgi:hypothetical protein